MTTKRRYPHPSGRAGASILADERTARALGLHLPAASPDWPQRVERIVQRAATLDPQNEATVVLLRDELGQHPGRPLASSIDTVARLEAATTDEAFALELAAWAEARAARPAPVVEVAVVAGPVDDTIPPSTPARSSARRRPRQTPPADA